MHARRKVPAKRQPEEGEIPLYVDIITCWRENESVRQAFGTLDRYVQHREDLHFNSTAIIRLSDFRSRHLRVVMLAPQEGTGGSNSPGATLQEQSSP